MYQIENFELNKSSVVGFQLKTGCLIRVTAGRLWLTLQGQPGDVWLQAGECWTMPAVNATVWLSAEPTTEFQIAQSITMRCWPGGKTLINLVARFWRSTADGALRIG